MAARRKKPDLISRLYGLALQGDARPALRLCLRTRPAALTEAERRYRERFLDRFHHRTESFPPTREPLVEELLSIYRSFWTPVLLGAPRSKAEATLRGRLHALLRRHGYRPGRSDGEREVLLRKLVRRHGYHAQFGRTLPHLDLLVWKYEREVVRTVALPGGRQRVTVVMMRRFVTHGWEEHATLGVAFPGGWATRRKLYCVVETYDTSSERFRVSYLGHEAQHFADYRAFPKLEQPDLEYRAKLAELCLARETHGGLLDAFVASAAANPGSPHALAAHCLLRDLARRVGATPSRLARVAPAAVRSAARMLLADHGARLRARGARTVRRLIAV